MRDEASAAERLAHTVKGKGPLNLYLIAGLDPAGAEPAVPS